MAFSPYDVLAHSGSGSARSNEERIKDRSFPTVVREVRPSYNRVFPVTRTTRDVCTKMEIRALTMTVSTWYGDGYDPL